MTSLRETVQQKQEVRDVLNGLADQTCLNYLRASGSPLALLINFQRARVSAFARLPPSPGYGG
jgi:hypothetical protein